MFNLSLEEGIVPSEWKEANITQLFKKGSRNKPENYRPVSLTSVVCKLLETLIRGHIVEFFVKHKLINTSQHGFLKARSCLTRVEKNHDFYINFFFLNLVYRYLYRCLNL